MNTSIERAKEVKLEIEAIEAEIDFLVGEKQDKLREIELYEEDDTGAEEEELGVIQISLNAKFAQIKKLYEEQQNLPEVNIRKEI